jgi:glycosyltransferase involved in cell wall biosynthesis
MSTIKETAATAGVSSVPGRAARVSVVIPVYNAARTLRACLESVAWADDVVVVDMFSTDGSVEICAEFPNTRLVQRRDYIFGNVNHGIELATGDWIIRHDSDEIITPELRDEILAKIEDGSIWDHDGYYVADLVNHFGVWLPADVPGKGGREKLFRKGFFHYPVKSEHEHPVVSGRWGHLRNVYLHDSNPNLAYMLKKMVYYAERDAERRSAAEAKSGWYIAYRVLKAFFSTSFRYWRWHGRLPNGLNPIISLSWAFKYLLDEGLVWEKALNPSLSHPEPSQAPKVREFGSNLEIPSTPGGIPRS